MTNQLLKKSFLSLSVAILAGPLSATGSYSNPAGAQQLQAGCTFCDIITRTNSGVVWAENNDVMVIGKPSRPGREATDLLIIPKKHVHNLKTLDANNIFDASILSKMGFMAQELGKQLAGSQDFWVEIHNGQDAFQSVMHLHMHFKSKNTWADTNKKPIRIS